MRRKIQGMIQLVRPELPAAAGVCVALGQTLALGGFAGARELLLGFVCGFCLSGSAMVSNDYFDLEVDRVNAPLRPLPAGMVTGREALGLSFVLGVLGLAAAGAMHPLALAAGLPVWIVGFLYNWKLKANGLWGNLMVSFSVAMTFVMGGISVGRAWSAQVWAFGLLAFLFDLAEEIAGDAMDAQGDRERGSRSLAIVHGSRAALRVSVGLFWAFSMLLAAAAGWASLGGAARAVLLWIAVSSAVFAAFLWRAQVGPAGRRWMRVLYLNGSLGLLAFLLVIRLP